VNISHNIGEPYQHEPESIYTRDRGVYRVFVYVNRTYIWKPFNISVAVENSVTISRFSDPVTVRLATNGKQYNVNISVYSR